MLLSIVSDHSAALASPGPSPLSPGTPAAPQYRLQVDLNTGAVRVGARCRRASLSGACERAGRSGVERVSMRLHAREIISAALLQDVEAALGRSGLPADRLELVVPETAALARLDSLLALSALRDRGLRLALAAATAGETILALLQRLPLTAVLLGRGLIADLPSNTGQAARLDTVIRTAHALGLVVLADGIETEPQRACLSALGCDAGQGPLFGNLRPGTSDDVACSAASTAPALPHDDLPRSRTHVRH